MASLIGMTESWRN